MAIHLKPLNQQTIVITGASSGIGLATTRAAAKRGAQVMLAARDGEALGRIISDLVAEGVASEKLASCVTDVSREEDVERLADETITRFGGFDTWVNNAGVGIISKVEATSSADHHQIFETNYFGLVYGSLAAVRHFRETGEPGALINLGSAVSDMPIAFSVAYSATKHAIKGFTDGLRIELMRDKAPVSVTLIKPSAIDTPFFDHAKSNMGAMGKAPGPQYAPSVVADAILHAAEHGMRDIAVGSTAALGGRLAALAPMAIDGQQSSAPATDLIDYGHQPYANNLYEPSGGHERSRFGHGRGFSATTLAQTQSGWLGLALLGAVGAVAVAVVGRRSHGLR